MTAYRVLAQHMFYSKRIQKIVHAQSEGAVLRLVSPELEGAHYYVVEIRERAYTRVVVRSVLVRYHRCCDGGFI